MGLDVKHYYNNNAIVDRSRSKAKQPDGMTMREWRKGPGSKYMIKRSIWQAIAPRGLNTSGPLSGKTATSFNNPSMGPPSTEFLHPLILAFAPDIEGFTLYLVDLRDSFSKSDKAWEQIQVHYRRINGRHVQKMRRERSNRAVVKAEELYGATDYHTRLQWVANLEHKWSQRRLLYLDEQRAAFSSGRIDTEARTELLAVFWEVVDTEIFEGKELPTWS